MSLECNIVVVWSFPDKEKWNVKHGWLKWLVSKVWKLVLSEHYLEDLNVLYMNLTCMFDQTECKSLSLQTFMISFLQTTTKLLLFILGKPHALPFLPSSHLPQSHFNTTSDGLNTCLCHEAGNSSCPLKWGPPSTNKTQIPGGLTQYSLYVNFS